MYRYNDSIIEVGQNPEMSPGDLRRLALTQTPSVDAGMKHCQKSKILIIS